MKTVFLICLYHIGKQVLVLLKLLSSELSKFISHRLVLNKAVSILLLFIIFLEPLQIQVLFVFLLGVSPVEFTTLLLLLFLYFGLDPLLVDFRLHVFANVLLLEMCVRLIKGYQIFRVIILLVKSFHAIDEGLVLVLSE